MEACGNGRGVVKLMIFGKVKNREEFECGI